MRIIAIIVVGIVLIVATVFITSPSGESAEMQSLKEQNAKLIETNNRVKQIELEIIESQLGSLDFKIYRLCHMSPPSTKENQRLCKRVDDRLKAIQAKQKVW